MNEKWELTEHGNYILKAEYANGLDVVLFAEGLNFRGYVGSTKRGIFNAKRATTLATAKRNALDMVRFVSNFN